MAGTASTESGLHGLHLPGAHLLLMLLFVVLEVFPITLLVSLEGLNHLLGLHLLNQERKNRAIYLLGMLSDTFFKIVDGGTSCIQGAIDRGHCVHIGIRIIKDTCHRALIF